MAAALLALAATVSCQQASNGTAAGQGSDPPGTRSEVGEKARPSPSWSPEPVPSVDIDQAVRDALEALPDAAGHYTIAVKELGSEDSVVHGAETGPYDCASIVKVNILAALLLQAQERDGGLTAEQKRLATAMIRSSDNTAADTLWRVIGGAEGLNAANERLGLTDTAGGSNALWGLTQTTAADQLLLLDAVFGDGSPLTAGSREYVASLMHGVVEGQRWGVTAAADSEDESALKNGWLPRSTTGLWDVNSIGRIETGGHTLLVAVLTDGQPSHQAGIDLVEKVTKTAVRALLDAGPAV